MTEHQIQADFFKWARYQKIDGIKLLHANPNGGKRSAITGAILKAEGAKAGVPDVSWPVARGGFIGLAIEFKTPAVPASNGKPSKSAGSMSSEQQKRIDAMQREGWCVTICTSWAAAARFLQGYAGMLRVGGLGND